MTEEAPQKANITEPAILLTVDRLFHKLFDKKKTVTQDELYEITRGNWVMGPDRDHAKYAFAVVDGHVQQVYEIHGWAANSARDADQINDNRWQFTGIIASNMQHYIGQSVAHYRKQGNPVLYVNIKEKRDG